MVFLIPEDDRFNIPVIYRNIVTLEVLYYLII